MENDLLLLVLSRDYLIKSWTEAATGKTKITQNIKIAETGEAAIGFLYNESNPVPRLVLLDMELPNADGVRVLKKIKSDPVRSGIPVIALVTDETRKYVNEALDAGADGYIVSAVDYTEYMNELDRIQYYWNNALQLAPSARHWPGWIATEAGDVRPEQTQSEFILLIQSEMYEGGYHAANFSEQLIVQRIRQVKDPGSALSFLFSHGHLMPKYIVLDLDFPRADVVRFMKMKNDDPVKKVIPVIGLLSANGMTADEAGVSVTLRKPADATGHRVNIVWMQTWWDQPDRLK